MAFSEIELARIDKTMAEFLGRIRPPAHIRDQLDFIYRIEGQSIEILEVRPRWRAPSEKTEMPFAKTTFVKSQGTWKVYWRRADGKWHRYEPNAEAGTLTELLAVIEKDEYGCFFG